MGVHSEHAPNPPRQGFMSYPAVCEPWSTPVSEVRYLAKHEEDDENNQLTIKNYETQQGAEYLNGQRQPEIGIRWVLSAKCTLKFAYSGGVVIYQYAKLK